MAKKMADEIFAAERDAEKIITDAEIKAHAALDDAEKTARETAEKIISEAEQKARGVTERAEQAAEETRLAAAREAEDIGKELEEKYETNIAGAIAAAEELLFQ